MWTRTTRPRDCLRCPFREVGRRTADTGVDPVYVAGGRIFILSTSHSFPIDQTPFAEEVGRVPHPNVVLFDVRVGFHVRRPFGILILFCRGAASAAPLRPIVKACLWVAQRFSAAITTHRVLCDVVGLTRRWHALGGLRFRQHRHPVILSAVAASRTRSCYEVEGPLPHMALFPPPDFFPACLAGGPSYREAKGGDVQPVPSVQLSGILFRTNHP